LGDPAPGGGLKVGDDAVAVGVDVEVMVEFLNCLDKFLKLLNATLKFA